MTEFDPAIHKHACRYHRIGEEHERCTMSGYHVCECGVRRPLGGEWDALPAEDPGFVQLRQAIKEYNRGSR